MTKNPDGSVRLVDQRSGSPEGTDTVSNVEFLQFANGTFSVADLFNNAPIVSIPNPNVQASSSQAIALSTLASATDPDGNSFAYLFYDATAGGGHFEVNGAAQAAGPIFAVSQLSQVTFVPGPAPLYDQPVGASDGKFSGWSPLHINGPTGVNSAPVVSVPNSNVQAPSSQAIALSSLASATDPENDPLSYLFYYFTAGSGHFEVNGVTKAAGTIFAVLVTPLSQVTFVPAAGGSSDDVLIGATDGKFSGWSSLHISGPTNSAPVVTVPNSNVQATLRPDIAALQSRQRHRSQQ